MSPIHLHNFPCRVETPELTLTNYRVLVEPASPGPWKATLYTRDAHERRALPRVSRVVPLGNRQWLIIGEEEAWRMSVIGGCGCSANTSETDPEVVAWLQDVVAQEPWAEVAAR